MTPWLSWPARLELTRCRPMAAASASEQPSPTKIAETSRSRASALISMLKRRGVLVRRSDDRVRLRIDQVHVAELRDETHGLPRLARGARIDPAAHLGVVDHEIDHGLHAHGLHDVERHVELLAIGAQVAAPLRDVLGPETENQLSTDVGFVARRAIGRHSESLI